MLFEIHLIICIFPIKTRRKKKFPKLVVSFIAKPNVPAFTELNKLPRWELHKNFTRIWPIWFFLISFFFFLFQAIKNYFTVLPTPLNHNWYQNHLHITWTRNLTTSKCYYTTSKWHLSLFKRLSVIIYRHWSHIYGVLSSSHGS